MTYFLCPLTSTVFSDSFIHLLQLLYINLQSTGAASVTCSPQYINPLGLEGDLGGNVEGREDPTVSMGSGRRKRRSTVKRILRNKRQDVPSTEQDLSQNITVVRETRNALKSTHIRDCMTLQSPCMHMHFRGDFRETLRR